MIRRHFTNFIKNSNNILSFSFILFFKKHGLLLPSLIYYKSFLSLYVTKRCCSTENVNKLDNSTSVKEKKMSDKMVNNEAKDKWCDLSSYIEEISIVPDVHSSDYVEKDDDLNGKKNKLQDRNVRKRQRESLQNLILRPSKYLPTKHFQHSLFKLPVPKLEDTLKRYEMALKPLIPPNQLENTQKLIKDFLKKDSKNLMSNSSIGGSISGTKHCKSQGERLQELLLLYDKHQFNFKHSSYISDDWFELYLKDRAPLPVNYNPYLAVKYDEDKRDGLVRAAYWLYSTVRWYKLYRLNRLRPEIFYFGNAVTPTASLLDPGPFIHPMPQRQFDFIGGDVYSNFNDNISKFIKGSDSVKEKLHYCRSSLFERVISSLPDSLSAKAMMFGSNFNAFPLDMSQYDSMFNATRIPKGGINNNINNNTCADKKDQIGDGIDQLVRFPFSPHIVVLYRGKQFKVTVADNNCNPLPPEQIYVRLKQIVDLGIDMKSNLFSNEGESDNILYSNFDIYENDNRVTEKDIDVGIFTTMNRNEWATVRTVLERVPMNKTSLNVIDSAMLVLALDLDFDSSFSDTSGNNLCTYKNVLATNRRFLVHHTDRWWDKPITVILTADGGLGVSFEHSWGDGVAVLRYIVDCFNDTIAMKSSIPFSNDSSKNLPASTEGVQQLSWDFNSNIYCDSGSSNSTKRSFKSADVDKDTVNYLRQTAIKAHKNLCNKLIKRLDYAIGIVDITGSCGCNHLLCSSSFSSLLGKSKVRDGVSEILSKSHPVFSVVKPDPFMQMAMQLAWWRLYNSTVSTYESASTAAFMKGRTECIRTASIHSQAFTIAFGPCAGGKRYHIGTANNGNNTSPSPAEKLQLLIKAADHHSKISKEAKIGQGIDRHLFALKNIAKKRYPNPIPASKFEDDKFDSISGGYCTFGGNSGGGETNNLPLHVPLFDDDPSYQALSSNVLSTSCLYSAAMIGGGFGPVNESGYGIGYAGAPHSLHFNVSCWNSIIGNNYGINNGNTPPVLYPAENFADAIVEACNDIIKLILEVKKNI